MKRTSPSVVTAMLCAGSVTAQFVSGKATRDALFLGALDFTALPTMLVATSLCSMLLVALNARGARRIAPAVLVPACFAVSGAFFLVEWLLASAMPRAAAVVVYLHISGAGPLLASGFWLIASERFDPRTAKRRFGQIAGAGTLGGLVSAVLAERVGAWFGVAALLPLLAAVQLVCAVLVRRLAIEAPAAHSDASDWVDELPARSGLRTLMEQPYLRHLALLVLLGTTSAALVDYLFKASAVETFGRGDTLLRFFALYYAATSLVTFVVQMLASRVVLERYGLALTASTPSLALLAGSLLGVAAPGFGSLIAARSGESVFRSSLFRAGYELFYTPIAAHEKRSAKAIIDVAFDRLGDAVGGGLVRLALVVAPAAASSVILLIGAACSAAALVIARRLNGGYIRTLESRLMKQAEGTDWGAMSTTRTMVLNSHIVRAAQLKREVADLNAMRAVALDPDVQDVVALRSRDRERVIDVLSREEGLTGGLVPYAIPLLAWDAVADHAVFALRKVAEDRVGELVDALLDPNQSFAVRRRLARVFSVCVSQRAADGMMLGLDDPRFDVRCQSARSLAAILDKNPRLHVDRERVCAVVLREVTVGRPVWESRRLLEGFERDDSQAPLDAFVRDRAGESLAHVFTLLGLVLPVEPLQVAFRSLNTDDPHLQGTALEYLEGVLPPAIRQGLWPFLERVPVSRPARPRDEVIADLLRSHHSIMLNLEDLRRRAAAVEVVEVVAMEPAV